MQLLQDGWNGPESTKISKFALETAGSMAMTISEGNVILPAVFATRNGGVTFQWDHEKAGMNLTITRMGDVYLHIFDSGNKEVYNVKTEPTIGSIRRAITQWQQIKNNQ
jgi:hypothetical protein